MKNSDAITKELLKFICFSSFLYTKPKDLILFVRQKDHFACYEQTLLMPKIHWLKDETPLQLDELRMTILPSSALEIEEIKELDEGSYRCNASGLNSNRLSNKANLVVSHSDDQLPIAPKFIAFSKDEIVIKGQTVTFDCASIRNSTPSIKWLKDRYNIDMTCVYIDVERWAVTLTAYRLQFVAFQCTRGLSQYTKFTKEEAKSNLVGNVTTRKNKLYNRDAANRARSIVRPSASVADLG
ncbi:hypothetical protein FQA39_LY09558 [Lamprigera yunnana]|nr:hypothetical protein FQA39_LY09558 [Lamprigera yunnana]